MLLSELRSLIQSQNSCLCVGLDTSPDRIPAQLFSDFSDPLLAFNQKVITATAPYAVAYKLNTAFYEALGSKGWELMEATVKAIPDHKMVIADAKRGDIGNTARQYAKAFFEYLDVDALTLSPYMGRDTVLPFLAYEDKSVILLALTSNASAADFQSLSIDNKPLYWHVMNQAVTWADAEQLMFVVGGTHLKALETIRQTFPGQGLLVPGIGAQGGELEGVLAKGLGPNKALLINVSRDVIYQSQGPDFAEAAGNQAAAYQGVMANFL